MPATTIPLAPNVPQPISIKYVDIFPNDTTKNNGVGYGPSLRLKGTIDGQEAQVYPKGFLDANLRTLINAGVIAAGTYSDDPTEKYTIPVEAGKVTVMMAQPAGERYAKFVVSSPATPVPTTKGGKLAVNMGPPLPNEDGYVASLVVSAPTATLGSGTALDRMSACLGGVLGMISEAATLKAGLEFTSEDIRAFTISLFIEGHGR